MRLLFFIVLLLAAGCATSKPEYTYGTVEVSDGQARLPKTEISDTWDGSVSLSIVSIVNEPETAAMRIIRTGDQFFWAGCKDVKFVYGPKDKRAMTDVSHRKDFDASGNHLEVISFAVDGEDLRDITLGKSPGFEICGESFELQPGHQRYISEFIDAWNGVIQR